MYSLKYYNFVLGHLKIYAQNNISANNLSTNAETPIFGNTKPYKHQLQNIL